VQIVKTVPYADPNHYQKVAPRVAAEIEGAVCGNQFDNTANRDQHYATTGPEIWHGTGGRIDAFTCATGTGGTLGGVSRYLKEQKPGLRIVLADPMGSGLYNWVKTGTLKSEGSSAVTEGIGIGRVTANLAMFAGRLDDYILIARPGLEPREARNIDAKTYGAEADVTVQLRPTLSMTVTGAWVRSENDTDDVPLAQTPPLEGTLSLDHDDGRRFGGLLLRGVQRQDRIHPGYGTIYSLDTEETPGFGVISLYGGYRLGEHLTATAGIDNLLDRAYFEHIQRGSADLGASMQRIFEPGRTLWLRLAMEF
jgi:hypothetical protein